MFPIVLKTEEDTSCAEPIYYLIAANGVFQVRDTPGYLAVTPAHGANPGLVEEKARLELRCAPVPTSLIDLILSFFDEVYRCYGGEAIVVLFYCPDTREWQARAPRQTIERYRASDGSWRVLQHLDYQHVSGPCGFLRFGTVHSHADGPAHASFTDCMDERFADGLHVIVGDFHKREQSRSAAFVANGMRFVVDPDEVFEARAVPDAPAPAAWMERVEQLEVERPLYGIYWHDQY